MDWMQSTTIVVLGIAAALIGLAVALLWRRLRRPKPVIDTPSAQTSLQRETKAAIEALVLGAALEDALAHLVQVYGPEYLDAFYARRMRRNVQPFREAIGPLEDPELTRVRQQQASDAEEALRRVTDSVRSDPTPPE